MDLDSLAIFVKVVQSGSFTQAARALGMPNSTVSAKVSALEKSLGVSLLSRTTRKLHVTESGSAFFKKCVRALEEIKDAQNELASRNEEPRGLLRLTCSTDVGHAIAPMLVKKFVARYPAVDVELVVTNRVVDLVDEGVDVAFRAGELADSTLVARKFINIQMNLWAAPEFLKKHGTPKTPKDLERLPFVRFSEMNGGGKGVEISNSRGGRARLPARARVIADDFETIKRLVILGEGIGLVPSFLCTEDAKTRRLSPVLPGWSAPAGDFSIVYPGHRFLAPKVRAFVDLAAAEIAGLANLD